MFTSQHEAEQHDTYLKRVMTVIPAVAVLVHLELVDETVVAGDRALGGGDAVHVRRVELSDAVPVDRGAHIRELICDW